MNRMHNPPHPGELLKEWLAGVSVTRAAEALNVTRAHLSRILNGHAGVSADMALRLSTALGTTPELWLNLQQAHDLWLASCRPMPAVERLRIESDAVPTGA